MPLILGRPFLSTANAHIDVGAGEIQLNINGQKEKFTFKPKVEQCSQVKAFNRIKKSEKELEKPSIPSIEALTEFVESLRIQKEAKQIKLHNHRNARRRIQRKKFLESEKKEVEATPTTKKVCRKKVSSSGTPPARRQPNQRYWESCSGLKTRALAIRYMVHIHHRIAYRIVYFPCIIFRFNST